MELVSTHQHIFWLCYKSLCSIHSKGTRRFDFIKYNIIRKLAYKVKYTSQINGDLIVFCKFKNKIFKN